MLNSLTFGILLLISSSGFARHSNPIEKNEFANADSSKPLISLLPVTDTNTLIVINSKVSGNLKYFKKAGIIVETDSIKKVSIVKFKDAVWKYGDQAKSGAVELIISGFNMPNDKNANEGIVEWPDIEASFPGGRERWKNYLEANLKGQIAADNAAPDGEYTVIISFIVDTDGSLSNILSLTLLGYGMELEAIRVIKEGPKWIPAIKNGHTVKAYRKQPITFVVRPR